MSQSREPGSHDLLIRDCSVVEVLGASPVLSHQDLAIDGTRIDTIGPTGGVGVARKMINGRGRIVFPGLVNCHGHAPMSLFRGTTDPMSLQPWLEWVKPFGSRYEEEDVYWGAVLAVCQMVRAGITTFADMYFRQDLVIPAVELVGIRAFLSEALMTGDVPGLRGSTSEQLKRADAFVRSQDDASEGRVTRGVAPHSVYACDEGLLREVAQLAGDAGCRVHTHLSETEREVVECEARYGRRPPRVLADCGLFDGRVLAAHAVHLDAADIALLREYAVSVAHNPASNLKLRSGLAPVPAMLEAGIHVGLGTDSAGSNDSLDLWRDTYLAAVLHRWDDDTSPADVALRLATIGGAAALGLDSQIGTITPGMKADLVVVDIDQPGLAPMIDLSRTLAFAARGVEAETVIVDGRVVVEDRRVLAVDELEVVRQCRARARRIFERGMIA